VVHVWEIEEEERESTQKIELVAFSLLECWIFEYGVIDQIDE
jgi:hypothetical protein